MAIRIELYRVIPKEYRFCNVGRKYQACDLQFGVDIDLNGDADGACMAASYAIRGIGALYRGDRDKKLVCYVNGEKVAQFLGGPIEVGAEAAAALFDGCRPDGSDFEYALRRAKAA